MSTYPLRGNGNGAKGTHFGPRKSARFMFATQSEQHLRISKLNSVSFRVNHLQNCRDVAASSGAAAVAIYQK